MHKGLASRVTKTAIIAQALKVKFMLERCCGTPNRKGYKELANSQLMSHLTTMLMSHFSRNLTKIT